MVNGQEFGQGSLLFVLILRIYVFGDEISINNFVWGCILQC